MIKEFMAEQSCSSFHIAAAKAIQMEESRGTGNRIVAVSERNVQNRDVHLNPVTTINTFLDQR